MAESERPKFEFFPWLKEQVTIPNFLTLLRLLATPFMCKYIIEDRQPALTAVIFAAIWLTDLLDGWIARHFNQITDVGKVFDPLVDKLFQISIAVSLFAVGRIPLWVLIILAVREMFMIVAGSILWFKQIVISSNVLGKLTTLYLVGVFFALVLWPREKLNCTPWLFLPWLLLSAASFVSYGLSLLRAKRNFQPSDVEANGSKHKNDLTAEEEKHISGLDNLSAKFREAVGIRNSRSAASPDREDDSVRE
ncbi:MAG: hypothetical protein GX907_00975 [Clostridiaceae bacterium]|nr:hypothetical protein [Clostridiaceae bacterium]